MARRASLDLSGEWRAAPAPVGDRDLGHPQGSVDDRSWVPVPVPGHWRSTPAFADHDGPLTYRTDFSDPQLRPGTSERTFLVVEGVQDAADVWLDGTYLGDTSGFAIPRWFEVTNLMRERAEHELTMEVASEPMSGSQTAESVGRSGSPEAGQNPGGIWRPVRVHTTGPVRVRHCRLRCPQADADGATLAVRVVLDCDEPRTVTLRTWVTRAETDPAETAVSADVTDGTEDVSAPVVVIERAHPLATGENHIEMVVPVPEPDLWWPRVLGDQPLYDVHIVVLVDDEPSDGHRWRTGLRQVQMDDFVTTVNGERLFLKGLAVGPTRGLLAGTKPEEVLGDIRLAVEAGLDLVRVHGHLARPELYAEADRTGILLWQDLPLHWAQTRQAKEPARQLARTVVDELAHHPSILLWCAHHEPLGSDSHGARAGHEDGRDRSRWRRMVARAVPSWNRNVLERSVAETLTASDGSRPVLPHPGTWPQGPVLMGSAIGGGGRPPTASAVVRRFRKRPRLGGLIAETGIHGAGDGVPSRDDPDEVRRHVESSRLLKYRRSGGFAAMALAELMADIDPDPSGSAAVGPDHGRRSTPSWEAFVAACAPIVAVLDELPDIVAVGDHLALGVHVVSDARQPVKDLRVLVTATWEGGTDPILRTGWAGEVGADAVARVGTVAFAVPEPTPAAEGQPTLVIDVELRRGARVIDRTGTHRTVTR